MTWKIIGQSVKGTSHAVSGKPCEDAICHTTLPLDNGQQVIICAVSDGAGSAKYAAEASAYVTSQIVRKLGTVAEEKSTLTENDIFPVAEDVYAALKTKATERNEPLNEFSCTLLGCILLEDRSLFFQVGDGAIVRDDGLGNYTNLWWPQNGEYQNTTSFFTDDELLSNLKVKEISEPVNEIAIFSDGLQLLVLNLENQSVHQPFFKNLFLPLRMADSKDRIEILQEKLIQYLNSESINNRTDDDKTLFLATKLSHAGPAAI